MQEGAVYCNTDSYWLIWLARLTAQTEQCVTHSIETILLIAMYTVYAFEWCDNVFFDWIKI